MTRTAGGRTATATGSTVLLLAATHFAAHADRVLPSVVAPVVQRQFALSDGATGLLLGPAFVIAYIAGTIAAGAVVDRVRRYRMIAWSLLTWSLASASMGLAQGWEGLMAARVFVGLGQAALAPAALSILLQPSTVGGGKRIATFTSGAALGRSGALLIGGALLAVLAALPVGWSGLADTATWRLLFAVTAVPNLVLAVLIFRRAEPPHTKGVSPAGGDGWRWAKGHRSALLSHLFVSAAAIILTQAVGAWAPSLFLRATGVGAAQAAILAGVVFLVAGPAGQFFGGMLIDRVLRAGGSPAAALAVLFLPAVPCAALLGLAQGLVAVTVAYFAVSFALGACAVAALASYQPLIPDDRRGAGNAAYFATVTLIGMGLGPPLVGFLSDALSAGSEGALGPAIAMVTAAVALPAAILSFSNRTRWSTAAAAVSSG